MPRPWRATLRGEEAHGEVQAWGGFISPVTICLPQVCPALSLLSIHHSHLSM